MKIAVASSGLGHVARGIETWAQDLAVALAERSVDVTLFAGAARGEQRAGGGERESGGTWELESGQRHEAGGKPERRADGVSEGPRSTFNPPQSTDGSSGAMLSVPCALPVRVLPCLKRTSVAARVLARCMPGFTWRWGLKSAYGVEQVSFWMRLWPQLTRGRFDILHVQDPIIGLWAQIFRNHGWSSTRVILAHGTEEPPEFLARFEYVQHLAPWHAEAKEPVEGGK